jgi:FkbM family methyltransferase
MILANIRSVIAKATPYFIRRYVPLKVLQHLYFSGVISARLNGKPVVKLVNKGHQIENEIYWRGFDGCHEKKSMQIFAEIMSVIKPKIVWDIGANSGTYGILAKALVKSTEVYFFEPIPKAVEMIRKNLALNDFDASVFELALGDYDGQGEIYFNKGADFATSVTVNKNTVQQDQASEAMKISVRRADSIMREFVLSTPVLVKLDVETYESEVMEGFGETQFGDCIFLIEILSDDLAQELISFFPRHKYDFYNINDKDSRIRKTETLAKSDFYNYLISPKSLNLGLRLESLQSI